MLGFVVGACNLFEIEKFKLSFNPPRCNVEEAPQVEEAE